MYFQLLTFSFLGQNTLVESGGQGGSGYGGVGGGERESDATSKADKGSENSSTNSVSTVLERDLDYDSRGKVFSPILKSESTQGASGF